MRRRGVTPHVARNTAGRRSAIDRRTTRHGGMNHFHLPISVKYTNILPVSVPPTPTQNFATFFRGLMLAVAARSMWGPLSAALNILIQGRCIGIGDQRYRLIAKIQAGAFVPRRSWPGRAPPHGGEGADSGGPGTLYPGHLHPLSR